MITLYSSGGAQDIEVLSPALDEIEWLTLRSRVAHLIRARGDGPIADLVDEMPFSLNWGTNHFNDEFMLLIGQLPVERDAKVGDGDPVRRAAYRLIGPVAASAIGEDGNVSGNVLGFRNLLSRFRAFQTPSRPSPRQSSKGLCAMLMPL